MCSPNAFGEIDYTIGRTLLLNEKKYVTKYFSSIETAASTVVSTAFRFFNMVFS